MFSNHLKNLSCSIFVRLVLRAFAFISRRLATSRSPSTLTSLDLCVEETGSICKADVGVVEVADAAKGEDRQHVHQRPGDLRQDLSVNVILGNSGQTPVCTIDITSNRHSAANNFTDFGLFSYAIYKLSKSTVK